MNPEVLFVNPPGRGDLSAASADFPGIAGGSWQGDSDLQTKTFGGI